MKIHCVIISWNGFYEKSRLISNEVCKYVEDLTIIYSNNLEEDEHGPGNWIKTPNEWFYGRKFSKALESIKEDETLLLIQADASYQDWPQLVARCRSIMMQIDNVGVWAPDISETSWTKNRVFVGESVDLKIEFVAQTDGIVFSFSKDVVRRLKKLDYQKNNLGWGIDWAAICYSYVNNKLVLRDSSIKVNHVAGSGYMLNEAANQMNHFLSQMTPQEKVAYKLLDSFTSYIVSDLRKNI